MSPSCCDFTTAAASHFTVAKAAKQLEAYQQGKVGPMTRLLRDGLVSTGLVRGSLLDVGAGIGALTFELLQRGVTTAVAVDASYPYLAAAKNEAERRHLTDVITFVHADFAAAAGTLPEFDVVALDRVVCCYDDYRLVLREAVGRARSAVAISYPRSVWFVRIGNAFENRMRWLRSNAFRTFIHSAADIQRIILNSGFELKSRNETLAWSADVYTRR